MNAVRVAAVAALLFVFWRAAEADKGTAPVSPIQLKVSKFSHTQHADEKVGAVKGDNCQDCHPTDKLGTLTSPGATGHQPCLGSGCHVQDFLASSARTKAKDQERYEKAAAFCRGCHDPTQAEPPKSYEKPVANNVFRNNPAPNYHVELEHFEHISKKTKDGATVGCRDCHVVDATTNELQLQTPGHTQCASCHGVNAPPMSDCAQCHEKPGPAEYIVKKRKGSDVRSCGSPGHLRAAKAARKSPDKVSCFKHETKKHRFNADGSRLECGACHYMFTNKKTWRKNKRYDTLKNIAAAPVIDNARDMAHKMCGNSSACHSRDVRLGSTGRNCKLCHSERVIENDLFE